MVRESNPSLTVIGRGPCHWTNHPLRKKTCRHSSVELSFHLGRHLGLSFDLCDRRRGGLGNHYGNRTRISDALTSAIVVAEETGPGLGNDPNPPNSQSGMLPLHYTWRCGPSFISRRWRVPFLLLFLFGCQRTPGSRERVVRVSIAKPRWWNLRESNPHLPGASRACYHSH